MKKNLFFLLMLLTFSAYSAVTPTETRYIVKQSNEFTNFTVKNSSSDDYMASIVIEDGLTQAKKNYLKVLPSLAIIKGNSNQLIRIVQSDISSLPLDRESFFYLVTQEIPPKSEENKNTLTVAIKTKIPLYYRPHSIESLDRDRQVKYLKWKIEEGKLIVVNPTPLYFSIPVLNEQTLGVNSIIIPPMDSVVVKGNSSLPRNFRYVSDFGAYVKIDI